MTPRYVNWIVCVRDIPAGEDKYIGPYRSREVADKIADQLRKNISKRGATHVLDAVVEEVRLAGDFQAFRDELLVDLDEMGYRYREEWRP